MIPVKNFFSGALGKVKNLEGSKFFTTPHTVNVKENYSINVGINSNCITCSLDGKLWLFENSVVALKFNNETKRLEFAASKNIEAEKFITRGIDWILTNKSIYLATDEEPYLFSEEYNNTSEQRVLYSVLRSSVLSEVPRGFTNVTAGSGIDPFTRAAWGMNNDNGNSEGWGFFNTNNFLLYPEGSHNMEQCYSILPKAGDWQIVENFLIRRPDNPLENQSQLAPLIPLEFNGYMLSRSVTYPTYGTGYNLNHRGIQLFIHNGELWGRGLMHIGKISILPAVFHEDGTVKDYYLYISPEYILSPYNQRTNPNMDANNDWLKLNFISTKNNELLGFKSEQNNGLCSVSSDGQIFNPDNNEWTSPVAGENGKLVLDTVNSSALFLGTEGIKFLSNNKSFTCKALSQWVAPANQVESVSDDLVISSFDNHTLATCIPRGFNRELLTQRKLNLSARTIDGKRLSMGISGSNITVNEVAAQKVSVPSSLNIFKNAVSIRLLNTISQFPNSDKYYPGIEWSSDYPIGIGYDYTYNFSSPFDYFYCYINPDTGEFTKIYIPYPDIEIDRSQYEYNVMSYDFELQIINQQICWTLVVYDDDNTFHYYYNYLTVTDIPTPVKKWGGGSDNCGLVLNSLCYPSVSVENAVSKKLSCCLNAIFNEVATNTKFAYEIPSWAKIDSNGDTSGLLPYYYMQHYSRAGLHNYGDTSSYKKDYRNRNRSMSNLHVINFSTSVLIDLDNNTWATVGKMLVFRSELNPDVFDFNNELLRSVVL